MKPPGCANPKTETGRLIIMCCILSFEDALAMGRSSYFLLDLASHVPVGLGECVDRVVIQCGGHSNSEE